MKKLFLALTLLLAVVVSQAQQPVKVETFKLKNGLKVVLCEEHSQPKVYGCVVVHAGSKNENPNATGVAHYFEHIMFKGTDRIGTTNWKEERLYLDSISQAYDRLQATKDDAKRHDIQKEINRLNIAASKYAIPNEVDAILQKMGCTGLNAGTSYDYTVYYNTLPSNQLTNWMDVYVERFRNPVFRLFQSELEAVYEEKNMYENQPMYDFSRNIFTQSFGSHPYSRDVIGHAEHLKNPQPSEMQKFFDTYYVANNMTLILVGDFNTAETRSLVEAKFGVWRSGTLPEPKKYDLPKFENQKIVDVKQTPIKAGIMVFPGVNNRDRDYLPLQMMCEILGGGSGLLDKAVSDGRLMMAQLMPFSLADAGSNVLIYIPNIIGQSHVGAEQVVWDCLDSIKQGKFSDELMQSIKVSRYVQMQSRVEDYNAISSLLLNLELEGSSYAEWQRENERWMNLTRDEIMEVANKYFSNEHCTLVRSKMGFPKHDAAVKPDWDHLEAQNQGEKSAFAKMIENNRPQPIMPQVVDFDRDVVTTQLSPNAKLYSCANPKNDIFRLEIGYNYGEIDDYDLSRAVAYKGSIGCDGMSLQEFNQLMDQFGASVWISENRDVTTLNITGLEQHIDTIMALASRWVFNPNHDQKQIAKIVDELRAGEKQAKNDASSWFSALRDYVTLGNLSGELRMTPYKEWGKRTPEQLQDEVVKIFGRNGYATFTGNTDPDNLAQLIRKCGFVREDVTVMPRRAFEAKKLDKSQVYFCTNKKFLQSDIMCYMMDGKFDKGDEAAAELFNEYFGGGMNSIVFQEIREFRSLGYSTAGRCQWNRLNLTPVTLYCYLGTQCDKTRDGVEAMRDLMVDLPVRPDKLGPAIEQLVLDRNSNYNTFRSLPGYVRECVEYKGWTRDMYPEITGQIGGLNMDHLKSFHQKYIKGRPLVVVISGNAKKFKVKDVAKLLGDNVPVTEVKFNQMFRF